MTNKTYNTEKWALYGLLTDDHDLRVTIDIDGELNVNLL